MNKNPGAFRTISEVAEDLDLPQHVLRFWETRFNQIKPMKRGGGRRYYRPDDVELLRGIKSLLYDEGYTIRGVQRLLKEQGNKIAIEFGKGNAADIVLPAQAGMLSEPQSEPKEAIEVAKYSDPKPQKGKGLISRITSRGKNDDEISGLGPVSAEQQKVLQATLQELLECKRLLDQTRQD